MAVSSLSPSSTNLTLTAECHCALFHATFTLASSSLPLQASICHCTTCRKTAGHMLPTWAVIPLTQRPDVSALTAYASSDSLTRYFCPGCGANIANFEAEEWDIATGLLDRISDRLLDRVQIWLEDAKDGGGGLWLNRALSERHIRGRTSEKLAFEGVKEMAEGSRKRSQATSLDPDSAHHEREDTEVDCLNASCHCGAVSFQIVRPDINADGSGSRKYQATLDACTSCRRVTGCEITSWAFMPRDRIKASVPDISKNNDNKGNTRRPLDLLDMSALSYYKTSSAVTRGFCSTCGANVFCYRHRGNTGKDDRIDIPTGLLESEAGVRAEDWLVWNHGEDAVEFVEDALDKGLVEGLIRGLQEAGGS